MKMKLMAAAISAALGGFMAQRGLAVGALAVSITKEEHTKLPKDAQGFYVERDGKFVLDLPEGVEDVSKVKGALDKERTAREKAEREAKELAKRFEGIDPEEVKRILDQMGTDEERKLMKDGKVDEVVARRMKKATEAHEKALKAAEDKVKLAEARAQKFSTQVLDNHVRSAAIKAGMHSNAVEDALFRARTMFTLDEEGNPVQRDSDGKVVMGKDSKTPYAPAEWLEGMKETAPHWFPAGSGGGGGKGDGGASGGGKTMKRSAFEALDPAAKQATMKEGTKLVD